MLLATLLFILRLFFLNSLNRLSVTLLLNRMFLSTVLFFLFTGLVALHTLLLYYQDSIYLPINSVDNVNYIGVFTYDNLLPHNALNLSLVSVYYYPFIYIFLIITVLSVLICLSYNSDELWVFMFYCTVIILAGYTLFFTDSLTLFFMAYEVLLIPSFFILYKFAKTRRCVEAAYLMFFWTQFGALFLIFAFIYMFLVSDTSTFSVISLVYFTPFEVNFIFICCFIGFGVKLPI